MNFKPIISILSVNMIQRERESITSLNVGMSIPDRDDPERPVALREIKNLLMLKDPPVADQSGKWTNAQTITKITEGYIDRLIKSDGGSGDQVFDDCLKLAFDAPNRHVQATAIGPLMSVLLYDWRAKIGDGEHFSLWDRNIYLKSRSEYIDEFARKILLVAETDDPLVRKEAVRTFIFLAGVAVNEEYPKPWPAVVNKEAEVARIVEYSRYTVVESLKLIDREENADNKSQYLFDLLGFIREYGFSFDEDYMISAHDEVLDKIGEFMSEPINAMRSVKMIYKVLNEEDHFDELKFTNHFTFEKLIELVQLAYGVNEAFGRKVAKPFISNLVEYSVCGKKNDNEKEIVVNFLVKLFLVKLLTRAASDAS